MSEVWINDVDLASFGFVLGADPGHARTPELSDQTSPVLGAIGPIWLGEPVAAAARKMLVAGHILAASSTGHKDAIDRLKELANAGAVRVRFADRPTQEFVGARMQLLDPTARQAILDTVGGNVAITFEITDPLRYDRDSLLFGLSTDPTELWTGTAPSLPIAIVSGGGASLVDPFFVYRDASGQPVWEMGFDVSLSASEFLLVDGVTARVIRSATGVQNDALDAWVAGEFPLVRPADGNYALSEWPTLELSATSGTPVGKISYRRAWL